MTKINDIITDEIGILYADTAVWCNNNNAMLEEIEPVEKVVGEEHSEFDEDRLEVKKTRTVRQFKVIPVPEPTDEQKQERVRAIRNQYLADTDKFMIADYPIGEEERARYRAYRTYLRVIPESPDFPDVDVKTFAEWKE